MARCRIYRGPGRGDPLTFLQSRLGIETKKVPTTLWVFVAVSIAWGLIAVGIHAARSEPLLLPLLGMLFTLAFAWLILRRSRVIWSLVVFTSALTLVTLPFSPSPWWLVVLTTLDLCLFVFPSTWRFIWRDRPAALTPHQVTAEPPGLTGSVRADGWYVDPDNPKRMRYWNDVAGEWLGSARTPRKIRQSWKPSG
jgi:hypothetical protein